MLNKQIPRTSQQRRRSRVEGQEIGDGRRRSSTTRNTDPRVAAVELNTLETREAKLNLSCPAVKYQEFIESQEWENIDLDKICETAPEGFKNLRQEEPVRAPIFNDTCSVCLTAFDESVGDQPYIRKLTCRHIFHDKCIMDWVLADHSTCPLCMQQINGL